jgi:hypothetical protein
MLELLLRGWIWIKLKARRFNVTFLAGLSLESTSFSENVNGLRRLALQYIDDGLVFLGGGV